MKGVARRGFLGLFATAPFVANDLADRAMLDADMRMFGEFERVAGVAGRTLDTNAIEGDWIKESADLLKHVAGFGGSANTPQDSLHALTPEHRAVLVSIDRRARKLKRLKSMSDAARDFYAAEGR
mgnify:CR=1 FL=1